MNFLERGSRAVWTVVEDEKTPFNDRKTHDSFYDQTVEEVMHRNTFLEKKKKKSRHPLFLAVDTLRALMRLPSIQYTVEMHQIFYLIHF